MIRKKRNWAHINAYVYIDRDDEVYNRQVNKWINKCFVIYNITYCTLSNARVGYLVSSTHTHPPLLLSFVLFATAQRVAVLFAHGRTR